MFASVMTLHVINRLPVDHSVYGASASGRFNTALIIAVTIK